jgi:hypothetical protein
VHGCVDRRGEFSQKRIALQSVLGVEITYAVRPNVVARAIGCDLASDDVDIGSPDCGKRSEPLELRNGRIVPPTQRLADPKLAALAVGIAKLTGAGVRAAHAQG